LAKTFAAELMQMDAHKVNACAISERSISWDLANDQQPTTAFALNDWFAED
jgi:hypothetical protein